MAVALALSILSVAAGALLATTPRVRAVGLGPIRTFALSAAGIAVLGHLLPEAVDGLGVVAFFAFTGALAAPWLIERIGGAWLGTHEHEHEDGHEHG
ncbi:MAG: hypothetical protein IT379_08605, partial [Deltaproteobacteria bacterium]|nr:hypothetical protein [Deltaproteobacteria bacterium]